MSLRLKKLLLCLGIAFCGALPHVSNAETPAWWVERLVTLPVNSDDFAPANVGQLKMIASQAYGEFNQLRHPNEPGAFPASGKLKDMIASWAILDATHQPGSAITSGLTNDFGPLSIGQLKDVAKPFYDHFRLKGYTHRYPWTDETEDDDDFAPATLGQLKNVFNFAPFIGRPFTAGVKGLPYDPLVRAPVLGKLEFGEPFPYVAHMYEPGNTTVPLSLSVTDVTSNSPKGVERVDFYAYHHDGPPGDPDRYSNAYHVGVVTSPDFGTQSYSINWNADIKAGFNNFLLEKMADLDSRSIVFYAVATNASGVTAISNEWWVQFYAGQQSFKVSRLTGSMVKELDPDDARDYEAWVVILKGVSNSETVIDYKLKGAPYATDQDFSLSTSPANAINSASTTTGTITVPAGQRSVVVKVKPKSPRAGAVKRDLAVMMKLTGYQWKESGEMEEGAYFPTPNGDYIPHIYLYEPINTSIPRVLSVVHGATTGGLIFGTIQEALDSARPGDSIEIGDGEYHELLKLKTGGAPSPNDDGRYNLSIKAVTPPSMVTGKPWPNHCSVIVEGTREITSGGRNWTNIGGTMWEVTLGSDDPLLQPSVSGTNYRTVDVPQQMFVKQGSEYIMMKRVGWNSDVATAQSDYYYEPPNMRTTWVGQFPDPVRDATGKALLVDDISFVASHPGYFCARRIADPQLNGTENDKLKITANLPVAYSAGSLTPDFYITVNNNHGVDGINFQDGCLFRTPHKSGTYVSISGLHFRHSNTATNAMNECGRAVELGRKSVFEKCIISECDGVALKTEGVVRGCSIVDNGNNGFEGVGFLLEDCLIARNNDREFNPNFGSGAMKMVENASGIIRRCTIEDNKGCGVWFDYCRAGGQIIVEYCTIRRQRNIYRIVPFSGGEQTIPVLYHPCGTGIFFEASMNAIIRNNVVENNEQSDFGLDSAQHVEIYLNSISKTSTSECAINALPQFGAIHPNGVRNSAHFASMHLNFHHNVVSVSNAAATGLTYALNLGARMWVNTNAGQESAVVQRLCWLGNSSDCNTFLYGTNTQEIDVFPKLTSSPHGYYGRFESGTSLLSDWREFTGFDLNSSMLQQP